MISDSSGIAEPELLSETSFVCNETEGWRDEEVEEESKEGRKWKEDEEEENRKMQVEREREKDRERWEGVRRKGYKPREGPVLLNLRLILKMPSLKRWSK